MAFLSMLFTVIRSPRFLVPFGFALGGFFLYLTIRGIEWGEVGEHLAETSLLAVVAAVAIMLLSSFLRAYRWRLMWTSERVTSWRLFTVEMAALGLNNFAPVRLMDEPAVLTMLTLRDKHPAATVVATIVMTRVQDIMFTMAFAFTAIVFEPRIADFAGPAIYLSGILIVFFVLLLNLGAGGAPHHRGWKDTGDPHLRADDKRSDAAEAGVGDHGVADHHLFAHAGPLRLGCWHRVWGSSSRSSRRPLWRSARSSSRQRCRGCRGPSARSNSRSWRYWRYGTCHANWG